MEIERQMTVYCPGCKVSRRVRRDAKDLTCQVCAWRLQQHVVPDHEPHFLEREAGR